MTKRLLLALAIASALALPARADFADVARAIDAHKGVKRVWIPFMGLARAAVRVVEPKGVHDFQLATFTGADEIDPDTLRETLRSRIGPGFKPLVQVWSKKSDERSFIYARPSANGRTIELIVLALDGDETVLVRLAVDPEVVARELSEHPKGVTRIGAR